MRLRVILNSNTPILKRRGNNMKPEEKDLLLKDLCARLPYGVHIWTNDKKHLELWSVELDENDVYWVNSVYEVDEVKPYLRPMSSMTEEEKLEFSLVPIYAFVHFNEIAKMDWLNEHHFDYRGLIDKGLAIEVTEENNPYKD